MLEAETSGSSGHRDTRASVGMVYLVGAGPGDPGLITLRGWKCLQRADLVLYDRLVNPWLIRGLSAECVQTCRGEGEAGRRLAQAEINQQLIAAAKAGKTVVRLKGGDPFIFGRGAEEAEALQAAGIPFEIVPGITAATAAAVYAGISLTHRELASAVALVTAHEDPAKLSATLDDSVLAHFPGTLVFYMGWQRLEQLTQRLISAGKPPDTPAAVITRATWPQQRLVSAPLSEIAGVAREAGLAPPSLIIIGPCVKRREQALWFERRPLIGLTIGITRPEEQADDVGDLAWELGAQPLLLPTIKILPPADWTPLDEVLPRLDEYGWIVFTSIHGVRFFWMRLWECGGDARWLHRCRLAAIGPSTAAQLQQYGLRCDVIPSSYHAEALAESLLSSVHGQRILWPRANRGRDTLIAMCQSAGVEIHPITVYRHEDVMTWDEPLQQRFQRGEVDWIGLSSPAIARQVARLLPAGAHQHLGSRLRLCAISPLTAAAALEAGLPVHATACEYTWRGIFDAIIAEARSQDAR
ncbi:MAG: uroporphyrinogen III methyltransferase [Planctomycetaceae bacterium]|nr:MAG: uroporphyrinogen III methyltransferase [Planctomycetaceae bacterium]